MKAGAYLIKDGKALDLKDYASLFLAHGRKLERGPSGKLYMYGSTKLPGQTHNIECLIRVDHLPIKDVLQLLGY